MRVLLIATVVDAAYPNTPIPGLYEKKAMMAPLQLATLAALTPPGVEVDLWDEPVHGIIDETTEFTHRYDVIGITGYFIHLARARQLARILRKTGAVLAIGGPGVTVQPETCRKDFDILFLGEAERTWPKFIADFQNGSYKSVYEESEFVDMLLTPAPRWEGMEHLLAPNYMAGAVQVNRGCPYDCEFCSVWQLTGRKMRTKAIPQVLEEVRTMQQAGMDRVFIVSDNFVGNPKYAKALMRELIPLNNSFDPPISYFAELTMTIARDEEMLELLNACNFSSVLIGIESPNLLSLKETRKRQNMRGDLVEECLKIGSYGILIEGSMILGFDHDTTEIFDLQFRFMQDANILVPRMNLLKAAPGTDLRKRLVGEGRVLDVERTYGRDRTAFMTANLTTDIIPKNMTRVELLRGYLDLVEKLLAWENFEKRMMGFLTGIRHPKHGQKPAPWASALLKETVKTMSADVREGVDRILAYTEEAVPYMTQEVVMRLRRHFFEVTKLPPMRASILRQIEVEESKKFEFCMVPVSAEMQARSAAVGERLVHL